MCARAAVAAVVVLGLGVAAAPARAAVKFRDIRVVSGVDVTSLTVPRPSYVPGDLLIAGTFAGDDRAPASVVTATWLVGWAPIARCPGTSTGGVPNCPAFGMGQLAAWAKASGANEPASYKFEFNTGAPQRGIHSAFVASYSGANANGLWSGRAARSGTESRKTTCPALFGEARPDEYVLCLAAVRGAATSPVIPAGMTLRANATPLRGTIGRSLFMADEPNPDWRWVPARAIGWSSPTVDANAQSAAIAITLPAEQGGPLLAVTGDLKSPGVDVSGRDLFGIDIEATDNGHGVASVQVRVDGQERALFEGADCTPACTSIADEFYLDTDTVPEGSHQIEVVARDADGRASRDRWSVTVPGENTFAGQLASWRTTVQQQVDAASSSPLSGPLAAPPDGWRRPDECRATEDALRACYDAVTNWGADVQAWLAQNLPDDAAAASLPDAPTFEYSPEDDVSRDLTRRIRDAFALARHAVATPTGSIDVAIGFHRPLTPAEVRAAVPAHATLQDESALTGAYDPLEAEWRGTARVSTPSSLDTSVEDFYARQSGLVAGNIEELEQEVPEDAEEAEDIQSVLQQARAFKGRLDERGAFITGVTVRLGPAQAATALRSSVAPASASDVKSIAPLPAGDGTATVGGDALAEMSVDVVDAADGAAGRAALAEPREPTCADRGEIGRVSDSILAPNPVYWAPSRHKADTVFGDRDGDGVLKVHRLRFRWQAAFGLAWMCADRNKDRNVEIEAMVYPETPRWSDNWESNSASKYTQTNMPGEIHQDDIASGDNPFKGGNPFDKSKYPDFAILAEDSRRFRYRKLYFVNFTTNEGDTSQGRVIYSAQASHRAAGASQQSYCNGRLRAYKSCMFTNVDLCYHHAWISDGPVYRRVDWSQRLGFLSRLADVRRRHPEEFDGAREVNSFCDPRPPGSWE